MGYEWLSDYEEWRRRSPQDVLDAVGTPKKGGGWNKVFMEWKKKNPQQRFDIPRWAHKVRNYFNREPQGLTLLGENQGFIGRFEHLGRQYWDAQKRGLKTAFALSGDVYRDEYNVTWYQMDAAATIYHLKKVKNAIEEGILQGAVGQGATPKFKLISPDDTGGSRETIIWSAFAPSGIRWDSGAGLRPSFFEKVIGKENHYEVVVSRIDTKSEWRGSYNYAETAVVGIDLHEKFDVKTHERDEDYKNPDKGPFFSTLKSRQFPVLSKDDMNW